MKKNDWILIITILLIAAIFWLIHTKFLQDEGSYVTISVDGKVIHQYSLEDDIDVEIKGVNEGINRLVIKNGKAKMIDANCPDKLCVHQKAISKDKETIVCLPNKVVIEVHAKEEQEYDAVVK
ncbi:NusG domain II-containing protein [Anaerosacchariphilus polymeriproducens]|uniref:NusG domain II-containing protein n=1 Tax=Anaerosacchariphilus polymeriproducens TaxID=1812858 RepID=A0A371AU92_9FIRM|nr:NusG domain II-containing protein [Anaerosacchariphilus polymeriproducens]RDU23109.1 NusG domain II-containing protein [Anaerosacchariphilus polymeriproducens]